MELREYPHPVTRLRSLFNRQSLDVVKYFFKAYPRRSVLMVALLVMSSFAEGLGLITLLPVLELAAGDAAQPSRAGEAVNDLLVGIGLDPSLGILLLLIVVGMTLKASFKWLAMSQVGYTIAHVAADLRLRLIRGWLEARWSYFAGMPPGRCANAISHEAHRASGAYREACAILSQVIQISLYLGLAILISWQIAVAALVAGVVFVYVMKGLVRISRDAGLEQTRIMKSLIERLTDALQGIKPIKAMARERHVQPLLEQETEGLNQAQRRQVMASATLKLFQEPLLVLMIAAGLYVVLSTGAIAFSGVMVMVFLFYRLMNLIYGLQREYQTMTITESAFWSMHEQASLAESQRESTTGTRRPERLRDGIALEDVNFGYGEKRVLRDVSLFIPAGRFVALYGPSGAGKTTIADLVVGLHRPETGQVRVDGVPLDELDLRAWRHSIGYVPQEILLFHSSIYDNVTLGDHDISREEVERALREAGAWDFVESREEGLDTIIGEKGAKFSGGQRQRISIARALLGDPSLLILDEATTALDPATEQAICETLKKLGDKVTILSISHQPAMRKAADIVYELEDGRVAEVEDDKARVRAAVAG